MHLNSPPWSPCILVELTKPKPTCTTVHVPVIRAPAATTTALNPLSLLLPSPSPLVVSWRNVHPAPLTFWSRENALVVCGRSVAFCTSPPPLSHVQEAFHTFVEAGANQLRLFVCTVCERLETLLTLLRGSKQSRMQLGPMGICVGVILFLWAHRVTRPPNSTC
eukprot:TRINITY_DN10834_c0_g1_i2.p1 TRINITY_DN10834_c0_g1~~TRINITY_DN10834_c0_g1_i2.p1  ORF type:complete len:164 (-),score=3.23 TRINITY_DN10834_c0_g1_i2:27-518(-)